MRILSRIIFAAMLAMAVIIIPLGAATIIMAIELGLLFEALFGILMLCGCIALSLYKVREFIAETEWELQDQNRIGGDELDSLPRGNNHHAGSVYRLYRGQTGIGRKRFPELE